MTDSRPGVTSAGEAGMVLSRPLGSLLSVRVNARLSNTTIPTSPSPRVSDSIGPGQGSKHSSFLKVLPGDPGYSLP